MVVTTLYRQNMFGADSEVGTASIVTWTVVSAAGF